MPCYSPIAAYYAAEVGSNGKRALVFDKRLSHSGIPVRLPCGQCVGCRLERSRAWAVRCMHEVRMHIHGGQSFLTLTYDPASVPELQGPGLRFTQTLVKRDLQLFMKRLRKKFGAGLRFYACGEYGDEGGRPHYHVLLFNQDFEDKKFYKMNKQGQPLYRSDVLRKLWPMGHNVVGGVDFESCAYVARYATKKITGEGSDEYYAGRLPEFGLMSRKPGIGHAYYMKYGHEMYETDTIVIRGQVCRPPRYYDEMFKMVDAMYVSELKEARRRKALSRSRVDATPERRRVREVFELRKAALFSRRSDT